MKTLRLFPIIDNQLRTLEDLCSCRSYPSVALTVGSPTMDARREFTQMLPMRSRARHDSNRQFECVEFVFEEKISPLVCQDWRLDFRSVLVVIRYLKFNYPLLQIRSSFHD